MPSSWQIWVHPEGFQLSEDDRIAAYRILMEEVKGRIAVIEEALAGKFDGLLPSNGVHELCYLELRMICEIVAVGVLIVHGDVSGIYNAKIVKQHAADWILNALAKLHPAAFPRPSIVVEEDGERFLEDIASGFLSREDLIALYRESS